MTLIWLLIKLAKVNKNSWDRFKFEEQADYIKKIIDLHSLVADKYDYFDLKKG